MSQTLVLECVFGIAGDMLVGALLDLGASEKALDDVLASLPVGGFETRVSRVTRSALDVCDFDVILDEEHDGHDHDMAFLHGSDASDHEHGHELEGGHDHGHSHGHGHEHEHDHGHEHRGLADVLGIINASSASARAKSIAAKTFDVLAQAEAKAHGVDVSEVHFHEVGAIDSIVDVLSAAVCLDDLDVSDVIVEALADGHGSIRCQHGIIPVPVPAVMNIVAANGIRMRRIDVEGELTTPTGAALVAAIRTSDRLPDGFTVAKVGLGAGKRSYGCPELLRAYLIEPETNDSAADIWELECDLDDCPGEALATALEHLMDAGAREAHYLPLHMKKNRPGWQLQVICDDEHLKALESIIFDDTTTIGIRRAKVERTTLARTPLVVKSDIGDVLAKRVVLPSGEARVYPEHDDVVRLAAESGVPYQDAWQAAVGACRKATR